MVHAAHRHRPLARHPHLASAAGMLSLLLSGCALLTGGDGPHVRRPLYDWAIINYTSIPYLGVRTAATYTQDGHLIEAVGGVESNGDERNVGNGFAPIPAMVHVHVDTHRAPGRPNFDVDVPVRGRIPDEPHFTGTIYFLITDGGVTVVPETPPQTAARVRADHAASVRWEASHAGSAPQLGPDGRWRIGLGVLCDSDGTLLPYH